MPARRYEDRVTLTGRPVPRQAQYADQAAPRQVPVLPPLHATRASMPYEAGHEPLSIVHVHSHSDGHGRQHSHLHAHAGDNRHSGASHPGNPGAGMPSAHLNSAPRGGETRGGGMNIEMRDRAELEALDRGAESASGFSLGERITRYLESQGVDVPASLRAAGYAAEHQAQDARDRVRRAEDIARALRKAKRALLFEQRGFLEHAPGFGIGKVGEAQQRVDQLSAALAEACVNDPELIAEANRRATR